MMRMSLCSNLGKAAFILPKIRHSFFNRFTHRAKLPFGRALF